jgi:hypothetical protein
MAWAPTKNATEIFQFRRGLSWANAANVVKKSRARIFTSRPSRLLIDGFAVHLEVFSCAQVGPLPSEQ